MKMRIMSEDHHHILQLEKDVPLAKEETAYMMSSDNPKRSESFRESDVLKEEDHVRKFIVHSFS